MEAQCASETALSFGVRPCSDLPAAISSKQLSCARVQDEAPPHALSLSGAGAARALAAYARLAALVGLGPCPMEAHCTSETALFFGARPCSDVPAAASNKQLSFACAQDEAPPRALSLSGGGAARRLVACARRAGCWLELFPALWKPTAPARRPSPLVHGRALTCQPRPPTSSFLAHVCKMKRHRARSLSREEAQHARLRCMSALRRWLDLVRALRKPTALARRPYPLVHGRALTCQPRPQTSSFLAHLLKMKHHRARSLFREEAQHAGLRRARAAPAAGWSCFLPYGSPLRQ